VNGPARPQERSGRTKGSDPPNYTPAVANAGELQATVGPGRKAKDEGEEDVPGSVAFETFTNPDHQDEFVSGTLHTQQANP
jgi:hypothetical protein